ncbi:MAG: lipoprotein LpqH [Mycolicibacterium sp.]|nr:lipoprotein LpqH [Mycolicibacterium sp.]
MVVGAIVVGCSSPPAPPPLAGTIPAGTAEVTVNGQKLATSKAVDCTFIQSMTTIKTGDDAGGATVVVDNAGELDAKSVDIRNLGGFTGSFWQNLGHEATVSLTGRTFTIAGIADGFNVENPSARVARTFSIKASC